MMLRHALNTVCNIGLASGVVATIAVTASLASNATLPIVEVEMVPTPAAPTWTLEDYGTFPTCLPQTVDAPLSTTLVTVPHGSDRRVVDQFDHVWTLNHDSDLTNDVWVIGYCR